MTNQEIRSRIDLTAALCMARLTTSSDRSYTEDAKYAYAAALALEAERVQRIAQGDY